MLDLNPIPNAHRWQRRQFFKRGFHKKWFARTKVYFTDPGTVYIDDGIKIGDETRIEPMVCLRNDKVQTVIGKGCKIGPQVEIIDCLIGDGVAVGPGAVLKRCTVARDVKIPHVCYLADATIGEKTNIGAGTITSNFDGFDKNPTVIGPRCFIGTFVDFIAPVTVGAESFIASRTRLSTKAEISPHSFVFEEVRNGRPHIVCNKNCSFKLPGHWKWLWTRKPVDPQLMSGLFIVLAERIEDYPSWLNSPCSGLANDKPQDVLKKYGEDGISMIRQCIEIKDLRIPMIQM